MKNQTCVYFKSEKVCIRIGDVLELELNGFQEVGKRSVEDV